MDGVKAQYDRIARSMGKTFEELEREQKEKIKRGELKKKTLEEEVCCAFCWFLALRIASHLFVFYSLIRTHHGLGC